MLKIQRQRCPLPLQPEFMEILEQELAQAFARDPALREHSGWTVNFRDPDYSADTGGFHPVEVLVDAHGALHYVTDFAYVGRAPYVELAKELDFDFSFGGAFQQFGREYPLSAGRALFTLYQENFVQYYRSGVYRVEVTPL